jgi:hypothetical protein
MRGEVIEAKRWVNATTGATASPYGAVPWTNRPGNTEPNWRLEACGWTIRWDNGTVGFGRVPFATKEEAENWLRRRAVT